MSEYPPKKLEATEIQGDFIPLPGRTRKRAAVVFRFAFHRYSHPFASLLRMFADVIPSAQCGRYTGKVRRNRRFLVSQIKSAQSVPILL